MLSKYLADDTKENEKRRRKRNAATIYAWLLRLTGLVILSALGAYLGGWL